MTAGRGPGQVHRPSAWGPSTGTCRFTRTTASSRRRGWRPSARTRCARPCWRAAAARIVSVIGVCGGVIDKFGMGAVMNRSLTIKSGQCHVQRYLKPLLARIADGEIDLSVVVTHRMELGKAPEGYETFKHKRDECVKVVLKP